MVLVWRFDRFARSVKQLIQALEEFRSLGIDFMSHQEALDTSTPMGRAMFTIIATMAELEGSVIRERVVAGIEYERVRGTKSGKPIGRPPAVFKRDQAKQLACPRLQLASDCSPTRRECEHRAQCVHGFQSGLEVLSGILARETAVGRHAARSKGVPYGARWPGQGPDRHHRPHLGRRASVNSERPREPLWREEFSILQAEERYVSRRQLTKGAREVRPPERNACA